MCTFEKVDNPKLSFLEINKDGVVRYKHTKKVITSKVYSSTGKLTIRILIKNILTRLFVEDLMVNQWVLKTNDILSFKDNDRSNCKLSNLKWKSYEDEFRSITKYKDKIFIIKRGNLKPIILLQDLRMYNLSESSRGFSKINTKTYGYLTSTMQYISVSVNLIKFIFSREVLEHLTIDEYKLIKKGHYSYEHYSK